MGAGDLGFVMLDKPSNEKEICLICVLSLHRQVGCVLFDNKHGKDRGAFR